MKIGLLNNLRAGRNDVQVGRLLASLAHRPDVVHAETTSVHVLPDALADLAAQDVELLVVNGGDGTLQHVLTELLGKRGFEDRVPLVAPLRGGRTNMTALDLGTTRDSACGMAALLEAVADGRIEERIVERQVLRVEYGYPLRSVYGMFFGAGAIHRAIECVHRVFPSGRSQGVFGATVTTAALLARAALLRDTRGVLAPDKAHVLLDGEPVHGGEFTLLMATTLDRLFAGMRPFWGAGPGEVRFTALAAGAPDLWRAAPGMLAGRPARRLAEKDGYTSRNVDCADLYLHAGFTVDGELEAPEPDRILTVTAEDTVRFVRV